MSGAYWRTQRAMQRKKARLCGRCGNPLPDYFLNSHTCEPRSLDMTTGDLDVFAATAVPRDRWQRPLIKQEGGKPKPYTRCTTFVGCLEDTFNLAKWQQRMVALGLASRSDLLLSVSAHSDDKAELDRICEAAKEAAAASSAATTGTALHRICERIDNGEKVEVPAAAKADVAAYQRATKGIRWTHIERITVHDGLQVAGTPDRIGVPADGKAMVYDLKTGSIEYGMGKIAMQLALYARSAVYDVETGARIPLDVDLDRAVVIHLPAGSGTCELVEVDIAAGWEGVLLAQQVRAWRTRKGLSRPLGAAPRSIADLIAAATDEMALRRLWAEHNAEWNDELTALAKQRLAALSAA